MTEERNAVAKSDSEKGFVFSVSDLLSLASLSIGSVRNTIHIEY